MRHRHGDTAGSAHSGIFFGLVLILAGTVLLLERFGLLRFNLIAHFWPLLWITVGGMLLFGQRRGHGRLFGVALISFGLLLELQRFGVLQVRVRDLWPLYLVGLGVFLLVRALRPPTPENLPRELTTNRVSEYAVFGGGDLRLGSQQFEGGNMTAALGGIEADLTRARIAQSPAILVVDAILGGVVLRVPQEWHVVMQGTAVFGGFESKALPPAEGGERQELIIRGLAVMGGVEVKN